MALALQFLVNILITGAIYALAASGLSFIYATTRVFHFGHGAVIALGAYLMWWLCFSVGLTPVLAVPIIIAVCVAVGCAMNELVYEPLRRRHARGFTILIAALALLMLGQGVLLGIFGPQPHSVALLTGVLRIGPVHLTVLQAVILATASLVIASTIVFLRMTQWGRAMRAVADNEDVAETLGINAVAVRRVTFAIGSALGAVAGMLYFLELNIEPGACITIVVKAFTVVVVGGAGTMEGVLTGSLLLSGVEQTSAWFLSTSWKNAIGFLVLFAFLIARPHGIFGRKRYL